MLTRIFIIFFALSVHFALGSTSGSLGCGNSPSTGLPTSSEVYDMKDGQDAYPWMVAIMKVNEEGRYEPWCTGFLVSNIHVVSAASCFENPNTTLYQTRIGNIHLNQSAKYGIESITVHPYYRPRHFYYNIAVFRLSRYVDEPNFNPICLPDAKLSRKNLTGFNTTFAGWGETRSGGEAASVLKQVNGIPVVSNEACDRTLREGIKEVFTSRFIRGITSHLLCAGSPENERNICVGDSGGPLMLSDRGRWFAVAVRSFGFGCGYARGPGGYTRITSYMKWILQSMLS